MIKEYEYLHGVVFSRICSVPEVEVSIRPYDHRGYSSFILNQSTGLYIKYSGKRLTPWGFTLTKSHLDEIREMHKKFGEVFISLVCYLDGVVVLSYKELERLIEPYENSCWISVSRRKNKMYSVSSSKGELDFKISKSSCPDKILSYLKSL